MDGDPISFDHQLFSIAPFHQHQHQHNQQPQHRHFPRRKVSRFLSIFGKCPSEQTTNNNTNNTAMLQGNGRYHRQRPEMDRMNPFNSDPTLERIPRCLFVFGPVVCFVMTMTALLHLWYAALWHPLVPVTAEDYVFGARVAWIATLLVLMQSWAIIATYTSKLIPLPPESQLVSRTHYNKSLADLKLSHPHILESIASFCKHCDRYRPVTAHHCRSAQRPQGQRKGRTKKKTKTRARRRRRGRRRENNNNSSSSSSSSKTRPAQFMAAYNPFQLLILAFSRLLPCPSIHLNSGCAEAAR